MTTGLSRETARLLLRALRAGDEDSVLTLLYAVLDAEWRDGEGKTDALRASVRGPGS